MSTTAALEAPATNTLAFPVTPTDETRTTENTIIRVSGATFDGLADTRHFLGEIEIPGMFCPPELCVDLVELNGNTTLLSGYVCPDGDVVTSNPRHDHLVGGIDLFATLAAIDVDDELVFEVGAGTPYGAIVEQVILRLAAMKH